MALQRHEGATLFFLKGDPCSYDNLVDVSLPKSFPFWSYRQICNFLTTQASHSTWTRQLTSFESLCTRNLPQRHLISLIYTMLFEEPNIKRDSACTTWGRELQISLSDEEWETIHEYAHKGSMNVAIQENCYKIKTGWYRTPSLLHKFSPSIPNTCWRCGKAEGTMLHVWWDCEPFWKKVHDIISQVTTYTLDYTQHNICCTIPHCLKVLITNLWPCTW